MDLELEWMFNLTAGPIRWICQDLEDYWYHNMDLAKNHGWNEAWKTGV